MIQKKAIDLYQQLTILSDLKAIEQFGSELSASQMKELLKQIVQHKAISENKLDALFVGFPKESFYDFVKNASLEDLSTFQQHTSSEPMQHHLSNLTYYLKKQALDGKNRIAIKIKELEVFDLTSITADDIQKYVKEIEILRDGIIALIQMINNSQKISWHSGRTDLIEILHEAKELCDKELMQVIGIQGDVSNPPTGLWKTFQDRLFSVFLTPNGDPLPPDTPAIDALANFSIWYLKDYWELKLLPQLKTEKELEQYSQPSALARRQELFQAVKKSLADHGLVTLSDLEKRCIFSKKALKNYLMSD